MRVGKPRTKREILALLRSERETLRGYGVRRLALFGSYAWGRPRAASDVDLVVDLEGIRVKEVADRIRQSLVYV